MITVSLMWSPLSYAQQTESWLTCTGNATADTAALQSAITGAAGDPRTIKLPRKANLAQRCTFNTKVIPANLAIDNTDGSGIFIVTGQTLTVQGPLISPAGKTSFFNVGGGQGTLIFTGKRYLDQNDVGTTSGTVAAGDDSRLSDTRTPTDNSVSTAKIQNLAVTAGKIANGTITDTQVASANKDGTTSTPSLRTLGTGAQQAAPGNDSRLSDTRTPTDGSVTDAKITGGGLSPSKITGTAVINSDSRLSDSRAPNGAAAGDLAGSYPNPTLAAIGSATGPIGDSTHVPVVTIDTKGRVTALTSAQIGSLVSVNSTDSTATIQTTITNNRTVYFNAGSYSLTAVLTVPSNTNLVGLGNPTLSTSQAYLFDLADKSNITVSGFNYGSIGQNTSTKIFESTQATNYSISGFNANGRVTLKSALDEAELVAYNRNVGSRANGVLYQGVGAAVNEFRQFLFVGDSNFRGFGLTHPKQDAFVNVIRESTTAHYGVEWTEGANFNLNQDAGVTTNGTKVGDTSSANNGNGICGRHISIAAGQTITFSIKASALRVFYTQISGGGTFSLSVNGSSPVNTSTDGSTVYAQWNVTSIYYAGAAGYADYPIPMNVTITGVSGNSIIEGYQATGRNPGQGFTISQLGADGDSSSKLAGNTQRLASLSVLSNLYRNAVIVLGEWTNDIFTSSGPQITPEVYESNLRAIIANIKASRTGIYGPEPILWVGPVPQTGAGFTPLNGYTVEMYRAVVYKLAYENGYQVIDVQSFANGNYNDQDLAFLYQGDGLHFNRAFHGLVGQGILEQTSPGIAFTNPGSNAVSRIGNFDPTISGETTAGTTTYNSRTATFQRTGSKVDVTIFVNWATASGTGNLLIGNLPYTARNVVATSYQTGAVFLNQLNTGGTGQLMPLVTPGQSQIHLYRSDATGGGGSSTLVAVQGSGILGIYLSYFTDDAP